MDDRELLERSAKAAGVSLRWQEWNPLADGSNAMLLMVRLRIDVTHFSTGVRANAPDADDCYEAYEDDPYAATRRAIVRAAAAMAEAQA